MRIVGIGASAGGMEALMELLSGLQDNTGAAYVLILHLSVEHENQIDIILGAYTTMPITVVEAVTQAEANHIYIISKNFNLIYKNGMLIPQTRDPEKRLNLPIDQFLHSLGENLGDQAIGMILSGSGTDGSRGIRTIKEAGGLILVQLPESAKFDGMPQAAIRLQIADRILPPAELGHTLSDILRLQAKNRNLAHLMDEENELTKGYLDRILRYIHEITGVNFSVYREPTLTRRLANRILLQRCSNIEQYFDLLTRDDKEIFALQKDFLIGVTRFFRNPAAFEALGKYVIPHIFATTKKSDDTIRVWVPACSTGEEAYTIGMLLSDYLEQHQLHYDFKIFGTDIDASAIKLAGEGFYTDNSSADLPPHLLQKYLIKEPNGYRIKGALRDKILFAVHNLLGDPPFIKMDLISCRNALIYFKTSAQRAVFSTFHFALNATGFLMLGPSESLGDVKHAFTQIVGKWKIFQKRENILLPIHSRIAPPQFSGSASPARMVDTAAGKTEINETVQSGENDPYTSYLIEHYTPTVLFINPQREVMYTNGMVDEYFSIPQASSRLLLGKMLPVNKMQIFQEGLDKCFQEEGSFLYNDIEFEKQGIKRNTNVRFQKVIFSEIGSPIAMVEIIPQEKRSSRKQPAERVIAKSTIKNEHLRQLEAKLLKVKNHRRKLVAELETINRELQNANRELVAANEELQSTNEELQSVNEELYTVNHELQLKNENLTSVNNDISNLLRSTEIGTIFLDKQLNIRRFTPAIRQQFKLLESDIGRPITHFSSAFENLDIGAASREVYKTLSPYEVEVKDREGFSYLMRILPYRTERDEVQGLVVNFVDIHELINAQQEILQLAHKFEAIFRHSKDIIMTMEMDGSLRMLNKSVGALKSNELSGKNLYDVLSPADAKLLKKAVKELYSKKIPQEVKIAFSAMPGTVVHYNVSVIAVMKEKKKSSSILSVMLRWQDVSEQVQEALEIDNAIREYQAFMDNTPYQIMLLERNGTVKYINYIRFNDLTKDAIIGKSVYSFANDFQKEQVKKVLDQVFSGASAEKISYEVETHNGAVVPIELVATPVVINGQISYAAVIIQPEGE